MTKKNTTIKCINYLKTIKIKLYNHFIEYINVCFIIF